MNWRIVHTGWASPVGEACFNTTPVETHVEKGVIEWQRWSASEILLGHTASLFLLQGLPLQKLFDESVFFEGPLPLIASQVSGPFILLAGQLGEVWRVPLRLSNVVLARVLVRPEGLKAEELLSALLASVLTT